MSNRRPHTPPQVKTRSAAAVLALFVMFSCIAVDLYIVAHSWAWVLFAALSAVQFFFVGAIILRSPPRPSSVTESTQSRRTAASVHFAGLLIFIGLTIFMFAKGNLAWIVGVAASILQIYGLTRALRRPARGARDTRRPN